MRLDEFLARCLAARKMSPIKDPYGMRLPFKIWRQYLPEAEFVIGALTAFELHQTASCYHEADEEGEGE